jgi:hypothetical protein
MEITQSGLLSYMYVNKPKLCYSADDYSALPVFRTKLSQLEWIITNTTVGGGDVYCRDKPRDQYPYQVVSVMILVAMTLASKNIFRFM